MKKCKNIITFFMILAIIFNGNISNIFAATLDKVVGKSGIFTKTEIIDNIEINVRADEGVFPSNSILSIKRINNDIANSKIKDAISKDNKSSNLSIEDMYCFDITILDNQGNELQPDTSRGEVFVTFKNIENIDNNKDNVQIWHINDNLDKVEQMNNNVEVTDKEVKFEAEHFSIYTVLINNTNKQSIKYFEGANDDTSYFIIENEEDLKLFRDIVNCNITDTINVEYISEDTNKTKESVSSFDTFSKNARVKNNITLSNTSKWQPIGTNENKYNGIFASYDETIYSINNVQVIDNYSGETKAEGLFGFIDSNAKINIKVNNNSYKLPETMESIKYLEGAGSAKSPYLIKTAEDMKYMRDTINKGIAGSGDGIINGTEGSIKGISACYKLDDSIGEEGIELGDNWEALCPAPTFNHWNPSNSFNGTLDGNNKTIKFNSNNEGLFGAVYNNGLIKNLHIEGNVSHENIDNDDYNIYLGIITGYNNGTIKNCNINGNIKFKSIKEGRRYIGGLVGANSYNGQLSYLCSSINIHFECEHSYFSCVGGIVALNYGAVSNIYNNNMLELCFDRTVGIINQVTVGGLIGTNSGNVYNTSNNINLNTNGNVNTIQIGGIIGQNNKKVYNNFVKGNISGNLTCLKDGSEIFSAAGGLVGGNSYENANIDNCYSLLDLSTFTITNSYRGSILGILNSSTIQYCYGKKGLELIGNRSTGAGQYYDISNNTIPETTIDSVIQHDKDTLYNKLNEHATAAGYSQWIISEAENDGYPIVKSQPTSIIPICDDSSSINIYGNGCKLFIKEENNATVIYYEDENEQQIKFNEIPFDNTKSVNVFGGFKEDYGDEYDKEGYIVMEGGKVDNIYGGSYKCDMQSSSTVIIKGGTVGNIYGGGLTDTDSMTARVLSGTTIDIQGGTISYIAANGVDNSPSQSKDVSTVMTKLINISGEPIIGTVGDNNTGINIDTFTNKKIIIKNELIGSSNSIVINTTNTSHNRTIASLVSNTNVNLDTLYIIGIATNQKLYKDSRNDVSNYKYDIKIVDTFNASLSSESNNVSVNSSTTIGQGFGEKVVAKGYPWTGILSTKGNYVLPNIITVKMNDVELLQDVEYSYNRYSGLLTVFNNKTIGNIEVIANGIYVPPITYIDVPIISNDKLYYTGKPQCPTIAENDAYTVNFENKTNVGEYISTISLKNKQTTRWKDGSTNDIEYKWSINKIDLQICANDNSIIYGENPTSAGVKYIGFVNNEDKTFLEGSLNYTYNYKIYDDIGKYQIKPTGYKSNNYNIVYKSGTLNVMPKTLSFKWPSNTKYKYDGNMKEIKASIIGIVNKDNVIISSYINNKATQIGKYIAKITGLAGRDKGNYTFTEGENISCKWSIIKNTDNRDTDKDNQNNNTGNNSDLKNNSSNNNKNNSSNNKTDINNNDISSNLPIDLAGGTNTILKESIEGIKNDKGDIIVKLNDGTIISANGNFDEQIRLMVRAIKKTRKEWTWIKNITKNFGNSIFAYDIFFVNSSGIRVNTNTKTNISIISREKNKNIEVYYLDSNSNSVKLNSKKENYTIKFTMNKNGYYSLVIDDKNNNLNDEIVNKNINQNSDEKANTEINTDKIGEDTESTEENVGSNAKEKDTLNDNGKLNNISKESYESKKSNLNEQNNKNSPVGINWMYIIICISVLICLTILIFIYKKKSSNDE